MSARILGIESSCDETAAAVVTTEGQVLSDVVYSQISVHGPFGGVVPELAARDHLKNIVPVVESALAHAGVSLSGIDAIAVTVRPGLAGALLVGTQLAKTIAFVTGLPLLGVDHLVGHLLAVFLQREGGASPPPFPYVALLVSGGHTALYRVGGPLAKDIAELGGTRDDAAGEAFDKVAKLLGLGYPGGPVIDRLAAQGNPRALRIPRPMRQGGSLEFSFSGIKTWVARYVADHGRPQSEQGLCDLCASFQHTMIETLIGKTVCAAKREDIPHIVLCGGVAANRGLRSRATEVCTQEGGILVYVPPVASCTDNAAMIAYAGAMRFLAKERDGLELSTSTRTLLPRVTRKGGGKRPG